MLDTILIVLLLVAAVYFTVATSGVQFRMIGEMMRLLARSGAKENYVGTAPGDTKDVAPEDKVSSPRVSSFQAFAVSIASRVGTGNLAGVATAIAVGGPGAVFWMWVIALLGAATAFVESTLAQLYKVKGEGSFRGGPAYYIQNGIHQRWWAVLFAVLITVTFGIAFNTVQSNTIADAFTESFGVPTWATGVALTVLTLAIICGGIQSIARFSQWVVPVMAIAYVLVALVIIALNISHFPRVIAMIVEDALGISQAVGGSVGIAMVWGIKRGLFSNEAGEGSTPNAAATAAVSHPVKQGLIQCLGVYTDTLLMCTATAFIILCSGVHATGSDGIVLTQQAIDMQIGLHGVGSTFISVAIFFFAFTSIVANYYYGETNLEFIVGKTRFSLFGRGFQLSRAVVGSYRVIVGAIVMLGSVMSLQTVWAFADITMALMTICNLAAIAVLGRYAVRCLRDYVAQRRAGRDPVYHSSTIPEIAKDTPCWGK